MDHRHGDLIGVDRKALVHRFVKVPGGGDVELNRRSGDSTGAAQVRVHLAIVSDAFKRGDFSIPGVVHEKPVAGTDVMTRKASVITYEVTASQDGAILRIRTSDPEALRAIHSFIDFQAREHRTPG